MKVETYDGLKQRRVLSGMISSTAVLSNAVVIWGDGRDALPSEPARIIAELCVEHFRKHGKAPRRRGFEGLLLCWESQNEGNPLLPAVAQLSAQVIDEGERNGKPNPDQVMDLTREVFVGARLDKALADAERLRKAGKYDEAVQRVAGIAKGGTAKGAGSWFFNDDDRIRAVFDRDREKPLIEWEGGLGEFYKAAFCREAFISFIGPEGVGKSMFLLDVAYRALLNRQRVAYFQVGDMSERQVQKRFLVRAAGRPWRAGTVRWPTSVREGVSEREDRSFAEPLDAAAALAARDKLFAREIRSRRQLFWMEVHPNSSINVVEMRDCLKRREQLDGWTADALVIDYADVLAPLPGRYEYRDQINRTWDALRMLSLDMHILVVTATQANRASYDAKVIRMKHASEDKRKLGHVTAMYGINVGPVEKEMGMFRLNCLKDREQEFSEDRCVHVAGCLALSEPTVLSVFPRFAAPSPNGNGRKQDNGKVNPQPVD